MLGYNSAQQVGEKPDGPKRVLFLEHIYKGP